jgi:hypothetical protein
VIEIGCTCGGGHSVSAYSPTGHAVGCALRAGEIRHFPVDTFGRSLADHTPRRGSDVEAWIKAHRDHWLLQTRQHAGEYVALDNLLEEYRLRADTGLSLSDDISLAGPWEQP